VAGRLHDLLARGVEIGESSPFEVAKVRTEWFARRRDLLDAEGGAGASRSALRSFCGGKLPHEFSLDETLHGAKLRELPTNLVELLRVRNPLLLLAGTTLEEAEVATEVAKKDVFPDIDLFGRHVTELDRTAWRAGIGLTIPLWNHNRGTVISATAQQSVASADARTLALELENSLQQATVDYQLALGEIQLHQEGWTSAARQSLDIVTFSFENGEASLLDVLDAQRSYLSVGLAEAESWARLAFARTDIERLIAGPLAWENTDE
jgi:outer membrane protein TolC